MPTERRLTLAAVEQLVATRAVGLPVFGNVSEIPWRRSGALRTSVDRELDLTEVLAACCAASARRDRRSESWFRLGLASTPGIAEAVPVLFEPVLSTTVWGEWVAVIDDQREAAMMRFGSMRVDDLEFLLGQPRGSGRRTLFSILVDGSGVGVDARPLVNDVTLRLERQAIVAVYDDRLLDDAVMLSWLDDLVALLDASPSDVVLDVLNAAEARRSSPGERLVATDEARDVVVSFERTVDALGASNALVDDSGVVSYDELRALVRSLSTRLREAGVVGTDVVALLAFPSRHFVAALLAVLHCGAAPALLDLQSPALRLAAGLRATGCRILLTDSGASAAALAVAEQLAEVIVLAIGEAGPDPGGEDLSPVKVAPDDPGYVLLTSGSTGTPKAVLQSRRTLNSIVEWQTERTGRDERLRTLQRSALSFDVAIQEILSTICSGGCLEFLPDSQRGDFAAMAEFIEERGIERLFIPPSGLHALLAAADTDQLASLREVICAGEPLTISAVVRLAFRSIGTRLDNQYGPTETHVCLAAWVEGDPFTWPDRPPIGQPLPGVAATVVDHDGRRLPVGATGELVVAGRTVALRYVGVSSDRFDDVEVDGEVMRRYRTGDLVRLRTDGGFEFVGREDDQVKVRGYRIELGEVEAAAMGTGLIRSAACGVRRSARADRLLLAVVPGSSIDKQRLLSDMAARLPAYMVPRPAEVAFVEQLPMTTSGKVDRNRLVLDLVRHADDEFESRRDGQLVRELWLKCLGVDDCTDDETFIGLGGDSLAAVELSAVLDDAAGLKVPLRAILDGMSLAGLEAMDRDRPDPAVEGAEVGAARVTEQAGLTSQDFPTLGTVWCVSPAEARHLYIDVIVCSTYGQFGFLDGPLETVVDVGANVGMFSMDVLRRHPDARVIAVEPHPELAEALRRNLGDRAMVVEAAAGDRSGRATLSVYPSMPAMSSLAPDLAYDHGLMEQLLANEAARAGATPSRMALRHHVEMAGQVDSVDVEVVRLSDVLEARSIVRISLLKIDVQHGEQDVLAGIDNHWWPKIDKVVVEVQDTDDGVAVSTALLNSKGFRVQVHQDAVIHHATPVHYLFASRS